MAEPVQPSERPPWHVVESLAWPTWPIAESDVRPDNLVNTDVKPTRWHGLSSCWLRETLDQPCAWPDAVGWSIQCQPKLVSER